MAESEVYVSEFYNDTRYVRGGKVDWNAPGWRDIKERRLPSAETFPLPMCADEKGETYRGLQPAFQGGGGLNVCVPLAEIFRCFDLGRAGIVPIKMFQFDRVTPVDAEYSVISLIESKSALLPGESKNIKPMMYEPDPPTRWMTIGASDGDIAVSASALAGADLWFDAKLPRRLFLSGGLTDALVQAGFAEVFDPIKCRVVPFH